MTVGKAILEAAIDRLEAEILMCAVVGQNRAWLLAHDENVLSTEQEKTFDAFVLRRKTSEPVAYITGEKEFYGREFRVTRDTLIPRPATEGLIDLTLDILAGKKVDVRDVDTAIVAGAILLGNIDDVHTVVDIGTGSGCIAITLVCERPDLRCIATDISEAALTVAKENAQRHGVGDCCTFVSGSLLEPVRAVTEPFLLVSNPPYIPAGESLMPDVGEYEPHAALFAGNDGMDVIKPLLAAARAHPACRGIVLECKKEQWEAVAGGLR
jgi:release factor glutamine methyltransferase